MSNKLPLKQEHLEILKSLQNKKLHIQREVQQIGLLKLDIETREQNIRTFYSETLQFEQKVTSLLENEYGQGVVDLESGTFTPQ